MGEEQAVIDIGSNTVRLVIFGGPPRSPVVLFNEKVTARLGRGVAEDGRISGRSKDAALAALARYAVILRARGVTRITTVATAATRDAANGADFLAAVAALGLQPCQLSGEEEAFASASGVAAAFPRACGIVADLGGGSLELVRLGGKGCKQGITMPFGTLRLPALLAQGQQGFRKRLTKQLSGQGWSGRSGETLYLVGGTFRAFARHVMHRGGLPLDDPHGFGMDPEEALSACRRLVRSKSQLSVPGVSASRLAMVPQAAALLAALIQALQPHRLIFSAWGLREGLVHATLSPKMRERDPLLDGVEAFTLQLGISRDLSDAFTRWIDPLFDAERQMPPPIASAAISLALASMRIEPNLRADTILEWALHKRWISLDTAQRAALAACLLAHCDRSLPEVVTRLVPAGLLQEAVTLGLAIRLCRRLTGCALPLIRASDLTRTAHSLVLELAPDAAALAVEAVQRDLSALANHLGLEAVLQTRKALD
ncbi:exopolyphosphatase [Novosphingobium sp. TH158]|uniref:Ppx/GppA phosphatase family protein n=1 Tax=Novosphingobium sp. TH158 TaxID=2067455 RepID=UPI000C7B9E41|nr:exopolyphosphatase [Novosphingobium sp. TH158]PLK26710.1 exopolyphosphatase [Novosphingobium sp. TH158]